MKNKIKEFEERMDIKERFRNGKLKNIHEILNETKELAKITMDNITNVECPKELEIKLQECRIVIVEFKEKIPKIKDILTKDKKYKDGSIRKSAINIFKCDKYKEYLNIFLTKISQNKMKSYLDAEKYITYNNLSANLTEITRILNVLDEITSVLIKALMKNDIVAIGNFIVPTSIVFKRIYKLYDLYGIYLEDIGKTSDYNSTLEILENVDKTFLFLMNLSLLTKGI